MQSLATETAPSKQTAPATSAANSRCCLVVGDRRGGVPRRGRHRLAGLEHLGAQVLDRLEGADLLAELLAHAGVLHRRVQAPPGDAGRLGGGQGDDEQRAAGRASGRGRRCRRRRSGRAREVRRVRSGLAPGVSSTPSRGTSRTSSSTTTRAWVDPGASWTTEPSRRQGDRAGRFGEGRRRRPRTPRSGPGSSAAAHASRATARSVSEPPSAVMPSSPSRDRGGDLGELCGRVVLGRAGQPRSRRASSPTCRRRPPARRGRR